MNDNPNELSARFYYSAKAIFLLAFCLIIPDAIGCIRSLPIDLSALPPTRAIRIIALLLSLSAVWNLFEWFASAEEAKMLRSNFVRLCFVLVVGGSSLLFTYPRIVEHTRFASVSRLWFVFYPVVGMCLGFIAGMMIIALSTIRTKEEAATKHLSRIPLKTVEVSIGGGLVVALLLVIYYLSLPHTPHELSILPATIVVFFFICVLSGFLSLLLPEKRNLELCLVKPTSPFIDGLKVANDFYDSYVWHFEHESDVKKKKETENSLFMLRMIQMSHSPGDVHVNFHVETPTEISLKIDSTDIGDLETVVVVSDEKEFPGRFSIGVYTGRFAHYGRFYLSEHKATINKHNESAFKASMMNQAVLETVGAICGESFYETALMGDISSAKTFLAKGEVDINETYEFRRTALIQAVQYGLLKMVSFLLENGADPSIPNVNNATPLSSAAMANSINICKLLVKYGAQGDVNKQDFIGMTPIMYAARHGNNEMVKLLMSFGADPNIKSKYGKSALDIARRFYHGNTARILRSGSTVVSTEASPG